MIKLITQIFNAPNRPYVVIWFRLNIPNTHSVWGEYLIYLILRTSNIILHSHLLDFYTCKIYKSLLICLPMDIHICDISMRYWYTTEKVKFFQSVYEKPLKSSSLNLTNFFYVDRLIQMNVYFQYLNTYVYVPGNYKPDSF